MLLAPVAGPTVGEMGVGGGVDGWCEDLRGGVAERASSSEAEEETSASSQESASGGDAAFRGFGEEVVLMLREEKFAFMSGRGGWLWGWLQRGGEGDGPLGVGDGIVGTNK